MKLYLENIGNFKNAEIELNGITVIAGKNETGKTTISKSLYAMFNGLNAIDEKVANSKAVEIQRILINFLSDMGPDLYYILIGFYSDLSNEIARKYKYNQLPSTETMFFEIKEMMLNDAIKYNVEQFDIDKISNLKVSDIGFVEEIKNKALSIDDEMLKTTIMKDYINNLFYGNILNQITTDESRIRLDIKNQTNVWSENSSLINESKLNNKAIYINNPLVIDEVAENEISTADIMKYDLLNKLKTTKMYEDDPIYSLKVENILKRISSIIGGNININSRIHTVKMSNNVELDIRNLATGLKTFAIINQLIKNRVINDNDVLLLDEPEVHLHPTMQVQLAELIVILQKEFKLSVLINTHSHYFIKAVVAYSKKYDSTEKCKFYNAVNVDGTNVIKDVSDNLNIIYNELDEGLELL